MKDFPNKCFGCKRIDVPLNGFDYFIRTNKKDHLRQRIITTTTRLVLPMCDACEAKFKKKPKLLKSYITVQKDGTYFFNDPEYAK